VLAKYRTKVLGNNWPSSLNFAENGPVANQDLAKMYARSRFTLNLGRQFNIANRINDLAASTPGPRTFEAAMAGTVQLFFVDSVEILTYFKRDQEILLFNSIDELDNHLFEKTPEQLEVIALAAQQRALRQHSYANRAETVMRHAFPSASLRPLAEHGEQQLYQGHAAVS
jgi:spore maturation protein CgeB